MGFLDGCWNCENNDICNPRNKYNKCRYYRKCTLFRELDKLANEMDNGEYVELE